MTPRDLTVEDTLKALQAKFGVENVRGKLDQPHVFVEMPLKAGGKFRTALLLPCAKFVAQNDICAEDLRAGQFPPAWPRLGLR